MSQFITSVFAFSTGAFVLAGDPLLAFLLAMFLLVWLAIVNVRVPAWAVRHKQTLAVRPD